MSGKKIILIVIIASSLFLLLGNLSLAGIDCNTDADCDRALKGTKCVDIEGKKQCRKPLEIIYPSIPGVPGVAVPQTTDVPLPSYINYIFRFAVAVIGFIILGAMVYAGVSYFLSFNNPSKLLDAKEGIVAAFLGGVILLAAFLIFNTINPQLTIITPPDISSLQGVAIPGIYICNYNVENEGYLQSLGFNDFSTVLASYIGELPPYTGEPPPGAEEAAKELQIKATKALGKMIFKKPGEQCQRLNTSTNLQQPILADYTMFIIPTVKIEPRGPQDPPAPNRPTIRRAYYDYAIILHEEDNFGGRAELYPTMVETSDPKYYMLYHDFALDGYKPGERLNRMGNRAKSVTLIKNSNPGPQAEGVTLYSCYNYGGICPILQGEENPIQTVDRTFNTGGADVRKIDNNELGPWPSGQNQPTGLEWNTRSLKIRPENSFIALINRERLNQQGEQWRFNRDKTTLAQSDFEWCSIPGVVPHSCSITRRGWNPLTWFGLMTRQQCIPCIRSMMLIKGTIQ